MQRISLLALSSLIVGCGGGGSSSGAVVATRKGTATVSVAWPSRATRFVPLSSNSVVVTLSLRGVQAAQQVVARPSDDATTSTASFSSLAYGTYDVALDAHPNADGSGNAQARGAARMAVSEDVPGALTVSLASTVDHLVLPSVAPIGPGGTRTLTVSAVDASDAVVLLSAGGGTEDLTWTSDSAAATVTGTGPTATLKGVSLGTANVTAALRKDDAGTLATGTAAVSVLAGSVDVFPGKAVFIYTRSKGGYTVSPASATFSVSLSPLLQGSTVSWSNGPRYSPPDAPPKSDIGPVSASVTKDGVTYSGRANLFFTQ